MDSQDPAMHRRNTAFFGTSSSVVFRVAVALAIMNGSISISLESSSSANSVTFPICNGTESSIGDGLCDIWNNNVVRMGMVAN